MPCLFCCRLLWLQQTSLPLSWFFLSLCSRYSLTGGGGNLRRQQKSVGLFKYIIFTYQTLNGRYFYTWIDVAQNIYLILHNPPTHPPQYPDIIHKKRNISFRDFQEKHTVVQYCIFCQSVVSSLIAMMQIGSIQSSTNCKQTNQVRLMQVATGVWQTHFL